MYPRLNFGVARNLLKPESKIQVLAELGVDITTDGKRNTLISGNTFSFDPKLGLEANYKKTIYLRAGIGNLQRVLDDKDTSNTKKITLYQPSVGIGLLVGIFNVDYAFTSLQTQSNALYTHIVSIRVNVKDAATKKKKTVNTSK